jgi:hypothetical protein
MIAIALSWGALGYLASLNSRDAKAFSCRLRKEQGAAALSLAEEAKNLADHLRMIRQMLDIDLDKEEIAACEYPLLQLPTNLAARSRWKTTTHVSVFAFQVNFTAHRRQVMFEQHTRGFATPIVEFIVDDKQPQPNIHEVFDMLVRHRAALLDYANSCTKETIKDVDRLQFQSDEIDRLARQLQAMKATTNISAQHLQQQPARILVIKSAKFGPSDGSTATDCTLKVKANIHNNAIDMAVSDGLLPVAFSMARLTESVFKQSYVLRVIYTIGEDSEREIVRYEGSRLVIPETEST